MKRNEIESDARKVRHSRHLCRGNGPFETPE